MFGLKEIYLYPYLNWVFYIFLVYLVIKFKSNKEKLFYIFIISLVLESAFIVDVGFFVKVNHIAGILLIFIAARFGFKIPAKYILLLSLFFIIAVVSILVNFDLAGLATIDVSRANFMRPVIQLTQFSILTLIMCSVITLLKKYNNFKQTMHFMHWISVIVALYATYEVASCVFHLPFINLNNDLPSYWYMGNVFPRPRSTFYEPINLNNFQFFGIACSLIYRQLYHKNDITFWVAFLLQVLVLIGSFSRSTLLVLAVVLPLMLIFYPQKRGRDIFPFLLKQCGIIVAVLFVVFFIVINFTKFSSDSKNSKRMDQILYSRMQNISEQLSILGRKNAINEVMDLYHDNRILLGIGIGNGPNWRGTVSTFSSMYNQIFIYTGIIGFTIFMLFLSLILFALFRNYFISGNTLINRRINFTFFVGLLAMLTQRLSFAGFLTDTYLWTAFAVGIYIEQNFRPLYELSGENISCGFQKRTPREL